MTTRVLPPIATGGSQVITVAGTQYAATPGQTVDVPDYAAATLVSAGWLQVGTVGPSTARPTSPRPGAFHFDLTMLPSTALLGLVVWDGATWRSPVDGSAV
jgi:hypothetical protein